MKLKIQDSSNQIHPFQPEEVHYQTINIPDNTKIIFYMELFLNKKV